MVGASTALGGGRKGRSQPGWLRVGAVSGAVAGILMLTAGPAAAAASSAAPYADPDAAGSIGLCNQAGQQITSGSITTKPFAWRAVSTQPATAPYNSAGRTATLVAYQPQQGLPSGDWSGAQMTSSSRYTNPANPMAAATAADQSLQDIIEQYPPKWDGFLQLRIYLGTANEPGDTQSYPALNVQVTGDIWQAVGGASVNCSSGTSESLESIVLPSTTTTSPATPPPTAAASDGGKSQSVGTTPATGSETSQSKHASGGKASASAAPAAAESARSSDLPLILGVVVAVLLVLAASTALVLRRRRLASQQPETGSAVSPPTSSSTSRSPISSSTKGD
jgi:hypothetical protein